MNRLSSHHQKLWDSPAGQEGRVMPLDLLESWQATSLEAALIWADAQPSSPEKTRLLFLVDSCLRSDYPENARDAAFIEITKTIK